MNPSLDEIDRHLRSYAARWTVAERPLPPYDVVALVRGAQQPALRPPTWTVADGGRRWVPIIAAAVAVVILAVGIGLAVRRPGQPPVTATPSPTSGAVAWLPLPPLAAPISAVTRPPSPDPAGASGLPPCRAADLDVSSQQDGASGTRFVFLTITSNSHCRLEGSPKVAALDRSGAALVVPIEHDVSSDRYNGPVAVGAGAPAVLALRWPSGWCADEIDVATLRIVLPSNGGELSVPGFGRSSCFGTSGSGEEAPITVGTFAPQDFTAKEVVTAFHDLALKAIVPVSVEAGEDLSFVVILTAPSAVPLDPCPDYQITLDTTEAKYALNCAGVPYRDTAGRPYLPAGTPVEFEMRAGPLPVAMTGVKLTWRLMVSDLVATGGSVDIR